MAAVGTADRVLALVIKEVLRLCGYIEYEGTSTAGTTTSLTDAANLRVPTAQANSITGKFYWMFSGTGIGQQPEIITYGSVGVGTWSPTLASPAADTGWCICKIRPQRAIDAIAEETRKARRKQAIEFLDESVMTNNLLGYYPTFEHWESGASSAPDGFTLGGSGAAVARESTIVAQGEYSVKVTAGGGAVGTLTRTLPTELNHLIKGQSLQLLGMIAENVAADLTVRVAVVSADGTTTNTDRAGTLTGNRWEELEDISTASISIPDPVRSVALSTRTAVSAVTYADDLFLGGPYLLDYPLPFQAIGIGMTILMETAYRSRIFTRELKYGADWIVGRRGVPETIGSLRQIHFLRPLPSARHLRMTLYREPDVVTSFSANVEPTPSWLAHAAAVRLMGQENIEPESPAAFRLSGLKAELKRLEGTSEGDVMKDKPIVWFETR